MKAAYRADDIEVLSGLDPVRRRPGMFTDTERPNYLAHEVIDNSVDEALTGHCKRIGVTLHEDGSLSVEDDGRGMPVDVHEETGLTGVELILTRLHAGAKFTRRQYRYSGGLHGVGVSVVNALSTRLKVRVRRGGREWHMEFAGGEPRRALEAVGNRRESEHRHLDPVLAGFRGISPGRSFTCPRFGACCAPRRCCAPD